ncbi:MAG: beta-propeller fold lactonase family protein [Chloroflexota bacterium]|nr:beta-propeller fold lactonase family protein [Chloroflexota bacterium]
MPLFHVLVAITGLLVLGVSGPASFAPAATSQSMTVGHVYVNANTARENSIAAYDRHADGTLTPLPGSPFAAGGAGTGEVIGSQDALRVTADGRYLLAVAAGSNEISVLRIAADGTLAPVEGSPFSSGGLMPVSIAVHDNLVYVANRGDGAEGANYTGFTLEDGGRLRPLANSTVPLSATANPGAVFFNATGTNLAGTQVGPDDGPSFIDSFAVGRDGRLLPAPGSPFAAQATGPFGGAFRPTDPAQLYVVNAHAGPNHGSASAYDVDRDGTLRAIGASPFPNRQTAPCWMVISPDGRYLFAVNTPVSSISRYAILADGGLDLLGSIIMNDPTGLQPIDVGIAPAGDVLYVVGAGAGVVSSFAVDGGNLTELPTSPVELPDGATPFGIAVT